MVRTMNGSIVVPVTHTRYLYVSKYFYLLSTSHKQGGEEYTEYIFCRVVKLSRSEGLPTKFMLADFGIDKQ